MRIFDPHAHMTSRTTDDYEAMAASGVQGARGAGVLARPAAHLGRLVHRLLQLAARLGALPRRRSSASAITARSASTRRRPTTTRLRREVIDILPRFLAKDGVVAVGEIGFDAMTPAEDEALHAQLALAVEHELPVLVHTPHRDKAARHAQDDRARRGLGHRARDGA